MRIKSTINESVIHSKSSICLKNVGRNVLTAAAFTREAQGGGGLPIKSDGKVRMLGLTPNPKV